MFKTNFEYFEDIELQIAQTELLIEKDLVIDDFKSQSSVFQLLFKSYISDNEFEKARDLIQFLKDRKY